MSAVEEVGFSCAACGKQYRWKPELAGKKVKCKCGNALAVPATPPTPGQAAKRPPAGAVQPGLAAAARSAEVQPRVATPARPAHAPPPPPPPPAPARKAKESTDDDGGMDALFALAQQEADVAEDATAGADLNFCPNCRNRMNPDAVLCTSCGYNRKSGKMLAAAAPKVSKPGGGFFAKLKGGGGGKVDAMAPQGSFFLGLLLSGAFAAGASIIWILVVWLTKFELAFLVLIVGAAAGVGMQVGQKGYSRLGGLSAALITFVVMGVARLIVYVLIVMSAVGSISSAMANKSDEEDIDGPIKLTDEYGGTKDPKSMILDEAEKAAKRKARERAEFDRKAAESNKGQPPPPPPPDPLLVEKLADDYLANVMKLDKNFATFDQVNAAHIHAQMQAEKMPLADREKMLVPIKAKRDRERAEAELLALETEYQFEETQKKNPAHKGPVAYTASGDIAKQNLEKMSPEEKKAELVRLKEWGKARRAEAEKEYAAEEKKRKEAEAKAAGVDDGLVEDPAAATKPAAAPTAVAAGGGDDGLGDGGGTAVAAAPAAPAADADPDADPDEDGEPAAAAAPAANNSATASSSGSARRHQIGDEDSSSDGSSAAGTLILGIVLFYIFIGGIFPGIFLLSALFLAYRTGAGATWG